MNSKLIIAGCVVLLGAFAAAWIGSQNIPNQASARGIDEGDRASVLNAPVTFFDFGTISMSKGKVRTRFAITNASSSDIVLPRLTTSCMCTAAYFVRTDGSKRGPFGMPGMGYVPALDESIGAGQSGEIEVEYDPAAHGPAGVGPIDRFVFLEDEVGGVLKLEIKAVVTP